MGLYVRRRPAPRPQARGRCPGCGGGRARARLGAARRGRGVCRWPRVRQRLRRRRADRHRERVQGGSSGAREAVQRVRRLGECACWLSLRRPGRILQHARDWRVQRRLRVLGHDADLCATGVCVCVCVCVRVCVCVLCVGLCVCARRGSVPCVKGI